MGDCREGLANGVWRNTFSNMVVALSSAAALVSVIAFTPRVVTVTRESEEVAWEAIDVIERYRPDYQRAAWLVEKASRRRPDNSIVLVSEAVLDMSIELLDRNGSARKTLERAAWKRPRFALPHYYMGRMDVYNGEYCRAIAHFENAIRKDPAEPEYVSWLGTAISMLHKYRTGRSCAGGDLEFAFECLSRTLDWPGRMEAIFFYRFADALLLHGMFGEATDVFWKGFHIDYIRERAERYRARFLAHIPYVYSHNEAKQVLSDIPHADSTWIAYDRAVLEWCVFEVPIVGVLSLLRSGRSSSALSQTRRFSAAIEADRDREEVCNEIRRRPLLWQDP